jgi:hypothetical protein
MSQAGLRGWAITGVPRYPRYKTSIAMIKGLMKQVGVRDELLEQQEELLIKERKSNKELKKFLALEKSKVEKLD